MAGRDRDFIYFPFPHTGGERDPQKMRELLKAHFQYERAHAARRVLVAALAVFSTLLWLGALPSAARLGPLRRPGLLLWAACAGMTLFFAILELRWYRRRERLMRDDRLPTHERGPSS